jgi:hypothetical protein
MAYWILRAISVAACPSQDDIRRNVMLCGKLAQQASVIGTQAKERSEIGCQIGQLHIFRR